MALVFRLWQHQKNRVLWLLLLLLVWGAWLWNLNLGSLSFDESATYFVAYRPFGEILHYLRGAAQEHPPVYYLLIRGWMGLTGTSEFALRYFSLLVGMLVVAVGGWLGRLVGQRYGEKGRWLGLVTAVFLATTPGMAFYARDARMYSLITLWAMLAAGLLLRDWLGANHWPRWTAVFTLGLINGLGLFTHYYFLFFLIVQPLLLLASRRWRPFWLWSGTHSLPALVGLAWLWLSSGLQTMLIATFRGATLGQPSLREMAALLRKLLSSSFSTPPTYFVPLIVLLLALGILVAWRRNGVVGLWLLLLLIVPLVAAFLVPREPQPRYLNYLLPFIALTLAHFTQLPRYLLSRWRRVGGLLTVLSVAAVAWLLGMAGLRPVLTAVKSRYGDAVQLVSDQQRPGDQVLFYGPWQEIPFHYYNPGNMPPITLLPPYAPPLLDTATAEPILSQLLPQVQRLWVLPTAVDTIDPDHVGWRWLRQHAHAVWQEPDFALYLPPLPADAPTTEMGLVFGDLVRLEQVAVEGEAVAAGEAVRLGLSWRFLQPQSPPIALQLSLMQGERQLWQTADFVLENDGSQTTFLDREGLLVPSGAPPGEYSLRLRLVDEAQGVVLAVDGAETAVLQTIQVTEPINPPVWTAATTAQTMCAPDQTACVTLVGAEPAGEFFQPGYPIPFWLHWQSAADHLPALEMRLSLSPQPRLAWLGNAAEPFVQKSESLAPGYGSHSWSAHRLVSVPLVLSLPADAPPGLAEARLELVDENGRLWTTPDGNSQISLFPVTVEPRPTLKRLPANMTPLYADFGSEIGLRGYRVTGRTCPGEQLQISYAWYARTQPTAIYAVFNHLVTPAEQMVVQVDSWPQGGQLLTSQWQPGEYIVDDYTLTIPADAPPEPYTLYIGFYTAQDGVRLPATLENGTPFPTDRVPIPLSGSCP